MPATRGHHQRRLGERAGGSVNCVSGWRAVNAGSVRRRAPWRRWVHPAPDLVTSASDAYVPRVSAADGERQA